MQARGSSAPCLVPHSPAPCSPGWAPEPLGSGAVGRSGERARGRVWCCELTHTFKMVSEHPSFPAARWPRAQCGRAQRSGCRWVWGCSRQVRRAGARGLREPGSLSPGCPRQGRGFAARAVAGVSRGGLSSARCRAALRGSRPRSWAFGALARAGAAQQADRSGSPPCPAAARLSCDRQLGGSGPWLQGHRPLQVLAEDGAEDHRAVSWTGAGAACAGVSTVLGLCPSSCTGGDTRGPQRRWWRGSPILPASPLWGWPCSPCMHGAGDRGQGPSGAIPWPHPPAMGCAWGGVWGLQPPQGRRCGGDGWVGLCLAQPQGFSVLPPHGLSPSSPHLSNT